MAAFTPEQRKQLEEAVSRIFPGNSHVWFFLAAPSASGNQPVEVSWTSNVLPEYKPQMKNALHQVADAI